MSAETKIMVSIICNAYNHEKYIEQCLEGFVIQKTKFDFEVLVHDDASTDNTAKIIHEYEEKYPSIIKPIYEKENQYSKHDGSLTRIQYGRAKGKYIAFCEGDDYWTDCYKLQKQFDVLENNIDVDICAHSAVKVRNGERVGLIAPYNEKVIIPADEVIAGGGGFVSTNSLMYRKEIRKNPLFNILSIDYVLQIVGSIRGGMYFLPDIMSAYRLGVENSWTKKMSKDSAKRIEHIKTVEKMLKALNTQTNGKYNEIIKWKINKNNFELLSCQNRHYEMLLKHNRIYFNRCSFKIKLKIVILSILEKMKHLRIW